MPGILYQKVEDYLYSIIPKRDSILTLIEKDAEKNSVPIIGPLEGRTISIILSASNAQRALEIGTATGYSGIWISRALRGKSRKLFTIELDESRRRKAQQNFERAGVSKYVEILAGDATAIVPRLASSQRESFDLVFLDIGKKSLYVDLLSDCLKLLKPEGFLIADNTLWNGEVADPESKGEEALTMKKFNKLVFSDARLDATIIPIRDGFTVARKKSNK